MSKDLEKKLGNSIRILYKVNSNLSEAFIHGMFKAKTKRYHLNDAVQKYSNKNKIEYLAYKESSSESEIYIMGTILTQTHLDILSTLIQKIVYVKEKKSYIVEISISEIARETGVKRETVSTYLDDFTIATIKTIADDMRFTCKIIANTFYIKQGKKTERVGIVFDPIFVLYFMYRIKTFKLPQNIQNVISKDLQTGIAKAIARYCYTHTYIEANLWDMLKEIDKDEYGNLKSSQKRKIRYMLKKDIDTLKELNIAIKNDIVIFKNPALLKKDNKVKVFANNNVALISFINHNISELSSTQH